MAKFFQKKQKKEENQQNSGLPKGMRALTPEEARKADQLKVNMSKDQLRDLLRAMGKSEEEVYEAFPDPLPEAEQQKKLLELRKLFTAHDYEQVIKVFRPISDRGLLSGEVEGECNFAIGFSGMMTKNKEIISLYGQAAISYLLKNVNKTGIEKTLGMIQYLMNLSENEVPGCMKEQARKLYPVLVNLLGEDAEMTQEVKGYM